MGLRTRVRLLWSGFIATTVVLGLFLALQYRWLGELERSSTIARRAMLGKLLEVVTKEASLRLQAGVEPALDVAAEDLLEPGRGRIARLFSGAPRACVRRLFVVGFHAKHPLFFFDPATRALGMPELSEESTAVWTAVAPWSVLAKKQAARAPRQIHADERDPRHRILMKTITDADSRLVGVAGAILDDGYFARRVLPETIRSIVPSFAEGDELMVFVGNERGQGVLPDGPAFPKTEWLVSRKLAPPYSAWPVAVRDRRSTPERWARRNFALNMSLSATLALLLLGGVLLALRTAAREMRLSTMKSDFVSNVSHELRTPLASVRVFAELLRQGKVTDAEKVREYGERIEVESRRLTQLVNNILDFSRIESGRKGLALEEADLGELVRESVAGFALRARSAGFRIELEEPLPRLPPVRLDREAIDQALCNLLDNAVKYSGGSREARVGLSRRGAAAVVSVADRGIGIPRGELERIFERFHRVSTGLVHEVRGVGLGLAIVRHVAQAHGGRVEVESEPGRGSTFSIVLPIVEPAAPAPAPAAVQERG